jgi:hypothetical protein
LNLALRNEAESLVLRQQLLVLSRKSRKSVRVRSVDRLIWVWLYDLFPLAIVIVKPRPHCAGSDEAFALLALEVLAS